MAIVPYTEEGEVLFAKSQHGRNSPQYKNDNTEKIHTIKNLKMKEIRSLQINRVVQKIFNNEGNRIAFGLLEIELENVQKALKEAGLAKRLVNFYLELKENAFSSSAKISYTQDKNYLRRLQKSLDRAQKKIEKELEKREKRLKESLGKLKSRETSLRKKMENLNEEIPAKEKKLKSSKKGNKQHKHTIQLLKQSIEEIKTYEELLFLLKSQPLYLEDQEREDKKKEFEALKKDFETQVKFLEEALAAEKTENELNSKKVEVKKRIMNLCRILGVEKIQKGELDPVIKNYLDKAEKLFSKEIIALFLEESLEKKKKNLDKKRINFNKIKENLDPELELLKEALSAEKTENELRNFQAKIRKSIKRLNSFKGMLRELDHLPDYLDKAKKFFKKRISNMNEKSRLNEERISEKEQFLEGLKKDLKETEEKLKITSKKIEEEQRKIEEKKRRTEKKQRRVAQKKDERF